MVLKYATNNLLENRGIMNKFRLYLKDNPKIPKIFVLGYIVFSGCVIFPFDFMKAYLVISPYGIIGGGLGGIYGKQKYKLIYISSLILTALGMIFRYVIEYGEVSNTMNFVAFKILSYLLVIPIYITGVYHIKSHNL